jgi:hypothetical protein
MLYSLATGQNTTVTGYLGNQGDLGSSNGVRNPTSDRLAFNNWIVNNLVAGRPIVVPVTVTKTGVNVVSNSSVSTTGHFIVLVGIDRTSVGSGSFIYYKDGINSDSQTKVVDYSTLLNSNLSNSSYGVYDALVIF